MIVVRLLGGLGNQFFQYAAGKALAEHHQTSCKLDLSYYEKHRYRKFELDKFKIPFEIASKKEINHYIGSNPIIRYINKYDNYFRCPNVFSQPHYHYYEDFMNLPGDIYLSGYWQSEKYFSVIRSKILEWYVPVNNLDSKSEEILSRMNNVNSVSLHIRRGDYKNDSILEPASMAYYDQAISHIEKEISDPHFFVFSDEIDWCKENIKIKNIIYVDHNTGSDSYRDLTLMAACKHNIIGNSTFSWWGAWLNKNPSKIIVTPKKWLKKYYADWKRPAYPSRFYNTKDLIPATWIKL